MVLFVEKTFPNQLLADMLFQGALNFNEKCDYVIHAWQPTEKFLRRNIINILSTGFVVSAYTLSIPIEKKKIWKLLSEYERTGHRGGNEP